ncbi:type II secretion system F family protein [Dyella caseinilytica]|uniref:Type II secretion system F family protein n=1 Tax=Dyella caseinilytica TaxID=1849581 RepID=A0ABX7GVE0_9GAMM|nr:type II secretion system F family protein [Dyella caseinilytica]QRN54381.1 type II secretion system F family protein [Dyella caseinilytica]GFZ93736.1 membrane protein [Dyella caseinilytica]
MNSTLLGLSVVTFLLVACVSYLLIQSSLVFWGRYQEAFTEQARFNLTDMFMFMDTKQLFRVNVVALVTVPALLWLVTRNPLLAGFALALIWLLPKKVYQWMRQRRIDKIQAQLPDGLLMVAGGMRAGLGFTPALESLTRDVEPPLSQEFALVLREQRMGVKLEEALVHFSDRVPVQDVTLFVSAVNISREVGGNLAESLALLAETLRRRLIMEGKVKSLTAQGRLQGIVMAMMPVGIIAFLSFAYPETMGAMYHTPLGWGVVAVAAVMEYLGYRMCRKITSIDI